MVTEFQIVVFVAFNLCVTAVGFWRSPLTLLLAGMAWLLLAILLWVEWGGTEGLVAASMVTLFAILVFAFAAVDASDTGEAL